MLAGGRMLESFRSYADRERTRRPAARLEHRGDQLSHEIGHKLDRPSSRHRPRGHPPLDQPPRRRPRPDRGGRGHLHPVSNREPTTRAAPRPRSSSSSASRSATPSAPSCLQGLEQYWIEIHRLENEAISSRARWSPTVPQWRDPLEVLSSGRTSTVCSRSASTPVRTSANVIERIVVKHA